MDNFEQKYEETIKCLIDDIVKHKGIDGIKPDVFKLNIKKHLRLKQSVVIDSILDRLVSHVFNQ
jgi:hypothetical protein